MYQPADVQQPVVCVHKEMQVRVIGQVLIESRTAREHSYLRPAKAVSENAAGTDSTK
jgi:hypothetical protein